MPWVTVQAGRRQQLLENFTVDIFFPQEPAIPTMLLFYSTHTIFTHPPMEQHKDTILRKVTIFL